MNTDYRKRITRYRNTYYYRVIARLLYSQLNNEMLTSKLFRKSDLLAFPVFFG